VTPLEDLVRAHPFFAGLPQEVVDLVAGCGTNVAYARASYVFREGGPADRFFLLRHGRVSLEAFLPGRGPRVFQTLGPGEVVGASWLVEPHVWSWDARALDTVRAIAFDAVCLRDKCDADPALGYALMKRFVPVVVARLQEARMQALDLYGRAS
jgi:CRP/FNR family transcriptional regulator, cyclic AMP receptor protein